MSNPNNQSTDSTVVSHSDEWPSINRAVLRSIIIRNARTW